MKMTEHEISGEIINAVFEVHRTLGPGMLELAYHKCLHYELSVEYLTETHFAQFLTYLKSGDYRLGLLLNFNTKNMRRGIRRVVNKL